MLRGFRRRCAARRLRLVFSTWRWAADSGAAARLAAADASAGLQLRKLQAALQAWWEVTAGERQLKQAVLDFRQRRASALLRSCMCEWHAVAADTTTMLLTKAGEAKCRVQAAVLQVSFDAIQSP